MAPCVTLFVSPRKMLCCCHSYCMAAFLKHTLTGTELLQESRCSRRECTYFKARRRTRIQNAPTVRCRDIMLRALVTLCCGNWERSLPTRNFVTGCCRGHSYREESACPARRNCQRRENALLVQIGRLVPPGQRQVWKRIYLFL